MFNIFVLLFSSVPEEHRSVNPGSVEAIQENPENEKQVWFDKKWQILVGPVLHEKLRQTWYFIDKIKHYIFRY